MSEMETIGKKRLEYLDFANKAFTAGDIATCTNYIDCFLATIRENSAFAIAIQKEFDSIEDKKNKTWVDIIEKSSKLDTWQQTEVRHQSAVAVTVESIKDKINACWKLALNHGAFND